MVAQEPRLVDEDMDVDRSRIVHLVLQLPHFRERLFRLCEIAQQQRQMGYIPQAEDLAHHASPLAAQFRCPPVVVARGPEIGHRAVQEIGQVGVGPGCLGGKVIGFGQLHRPSQNFECHIGRPVVQHPHRRQRVSLHVHRPQALGHVQGLLAEVQRPVRHPVEEMRARRLVKEPGQLGSLLSITDGIQTLLA